MKKTTKTLTAFTLAAALSFAIVGPGASAAAAKPVLSVKGKVSIFTGQKKTVIIKNVKKADVKSLKVVSKNKSSTKVVKKILKKKKVGFVLKAVGPHASAIEVTLLLNKKLAGKTKYKFELTTITGVKDAPDVNLVDGVKQKDHHATVFKQGAEPAEWENWIELGIANKSKMDMRNIDIQWYENGQPADDATDGNTRYRPRTDIINDTEKGYDEGTVTCEVTNCVSGESDSDDHTFRIVSQSCIDQATQALKDFSTKYPYTSPNDVPSDSDFKTTYNKDFYNLLQQYGIILGLTDDTVNYFGDIYLDGMDDPSKDAGAILSDETAKYETECKQNAENLGIPEADIELFCNIINVHMQKDMADDVEWPPKQDTDEDVSTSPDYFKVIYFQNGGYVARLGVIPLYNNLYSEDNAVYTRGLSAGLSQSVTLGPAPTTEMWVGYQCWFFGWTNLTIFWPGTVTLYMRAGITTATTGGKTFFSDQPFSFIDQGGAKYEGVGKQISF